jgi:septation ring formation regulator EzrA|tara:strand:- start:1960 stop:2415 length:456 start_codon:yes stop_codon:yes gene_type:complete
MSKDRVDVSDSTAVSMPIRNMLAIIAAVGVGVWSYFGIIERLNRLETNTTLLEKDLNQAVEMVSADMEKNTEFRIKWPRGEMGSLPADSEQFMLIEHIAGQVEQIQKSMESMMNNGVNIKRLQEDVKILRDDVEKLKDSNREIIFKNGNGQ